MTYKKLLFSIDGFVARITLNRPEKRNALDDQLVEELKLAFREAGHSAEARVVLLRGTGKDFCAGMDLRVLQRIQQLDVMENIKDAKSLMELFVLMRGLTQPIVAAVQGRALAGGCGLATACDLIVASRSAQFGYTETKIGFVPAIVSVLARRAVTEKKIFELLARAETISAEDAERIGLINRVFDEEQFEAKVDEYISVFSRLSSSAVALTKSLLYSTDGMPWDQAMHAGVEVNTLARLTEDCKKGVAEFLAKKK